MNAKEIVGAVAVVALFGVAAWVTVKEKEIEAKAPRKRGGFWEEATERERIQTLEEAMRRERDPEVRKELAKQLGRSRLSLAA